VTLAHRHSLTPTSPTPRLSLQRGQHLCLDVGGKLTAVTPVRCFPWSAETEYISLREPNGKELHLVQHANELDPESAQALATALASVGFVLEVCRIESIQEDYELRIWKVDTAQGPRTFQTPLDTWPWPSPDGGYFVRDLCGDLFRLPPPDTLDVGSRQKLWAYVG
jgi:hypothetical protein